MTKLIDVAFLLFLAMAMMVAMLAGPSTYRD
jgi:hypothetical protein